MKLIWGTVLTLIILSGLVFFDSSIVFAQSGLVVVIDSDTTWTKADSPYELSAPVRVNNDATLTIEAGVTVNFNDYEMRVEGTFVCGGDWDQVHLNNGLINLTTTNNGWNQQTKLGHIIQNTVMDKMDVSSKVPMKIINCNSEYSEISTTGPSLIQDNTISSISIHGNGTRIENNKIGTLNVYDGTIKISHQTISNIDCKDASLEISDCTINSIHGYGEDFKITNNNIGQIGNYQAGASSDKEVQYFEVNSAEITNNVIEKVAYVYGGTVKISNNVFEGYVLGNQLAGAHLSSIGQCPIISAINKGYFFEISNNKITGHTYKYTYDMYYMWLTTLNGTSTTTGIDVHWGSVVVANNTITDCSTAISGANQVEGNNLIDNWCGIRVMGKDSEIRSNTITGGEEGISTGNGGLAIIENNFVTKQTKCGVKVYWHSIVCNNNTITSCPNAFDLTFCDSATINYNNIENYNNSIYLTETYGTIDATNNWWGTTDEETIGLSIYDSKYSLDLGTVNFTPFSTEENINAQPKYSTQIPEFPAWALLPLAVVIILIAIIFKKKIP